MASKIGTILSMIFVLMLFLFASDFMCLQYIYSDLDSKALTISYQIAQNQVIDSSFIKNIENNYNVIFTYSGPSNPSYGEIVDFKISKSFKPIILSSNKMMINVNRTAVVGYYG